MKQLLLLLLTLPGVLSAQVYNFEDGSVPPGWSTSGGGTVSVTTDKSKLGNRSLQWNWVKGSYLQINNPTNLSSASTTTAGGIRFYLYNPQASEEELSIRFYNTSSSLKCRSSFKLGFKGWRTIWNRFVEDMDHNRSDLSQMRIYPPSNANSGTLYLDVMEFSSNVPWSRMSDQQYSVKQSSSMEDFMGKYQHKINASNVILQPGETEAIERIIARIDEWFLGNGQYTSSPEYIGRLNKIKAWIDNARSKYPVLTHDSDGTVRGDGLFMMDYTAKVDGTQPTLFRNVSSTLMIPLAYDYRMNHSQAAADKLIDLYDWFYDQGWAGGSSLGSLYFEKLRSGGYFYSLFLARKALNADRLQRELETLRWYTLFGTALTMNSIGETADNLRTLLIPKLFCALLQPTDKEQALAMRSFRDYCVYAFSPTSSYFGSFYSDYLGGHHLGAYLGAYFPHALYTASQVAYLLRETPYALPDHILQHLKQSMLSFTNFCSEYDVPTASNGRFPNGTTIIDSQIFAFGYLATALNDDPDLICAMRRLWRPSMDPIKKAIESASMDITFTSTVGEVEAALYAVSKGTEEEIPGNRSTYYPFGGLSVFSSPLSHLTIKGSSCYIWDYESGGTTENPFGRYLSYGTMELTDRATKKKNPCFPVRNDHTMVSLFNWNRLPGTTTIELTNDDLNYSIGGNNKHRNFTDQVYLGGTNLNDTLGSFSMILHDLTFNTSFAYHKSVFRFGNTYYCMGTNIRNNNSLQNTVSTLFQTELTSSENITIDGATFVSNQKNITQPTIEDNLGTRYIILKGSVDIEKRTANNRSAVSAVIQHGKAPSSASYTYVMMPRPTSEQIDQWSNSAQHPIVVEQQDQTAHILFHKETKTRAHHLFSTLYSNPKGMIQSVSNPCLILSQEYANGKYKLVLSDPDLRRATGKNIDALSDTDLRKPSQASDFRCTLNGYYRSRLLPQEFTISYNEGKTLLQGTVKEGKSYRFELELDSTWIDLIEGEIQFDYSLENGFFTLNYHNPRNYSLQLSDLEGQIIKRLENQKEQSYFPLYLPQGVYLLTLTDAIGRTTRKIMVR